MTKTAIAKLTASPDQPQVSQRGAPAGGLIRAPVPWLTPAQGRMSEMLAVLQEDLTDRYTFERLIGRGGMASVFLATDRKHSRRVAVKVLDPSLAAALAADRFLREIRITAGLVHPHILPLFESGEAGGTLFFVVPFVEGESLRARLAREKQLPIDDALRIVQEIADALQYAHDRGVIHRDVKPENILLSGGHAYLADFGIARAIAAAGTPGHVELTAVGIAIGTPAYMSPEQASGDSGVDHRSDIYSLACVLFEGLAGDPPFSGSNAQSVIARHIAEPAPSLRAVRPSVPESVERAIHKALAKTPADRFRTAAAFVEALTRPYSVSVAPPLKTILVLPFVNVTRDPDQDFFADGLTDELIADLSKVHALRVISRTSAMRLKGTDRDLRTVARELGVQYVVEGSVRRAGKDIRITAQLVDAANDTHLWANKYTGTLDEIFSIQERLSRTIVDNLEVTLSTAESRRLAQGSLHNPHAYECFLRARSEMWQFSPTSLRNAIHLVEQALSILGDDSLLYATLAFAIGQHFSFGVPLDPSYLRKADDYVAKAFALAPDSHHGFLARGFLRHGRGEFQAAVHDLKKALLVDPNNADALAVLGYMYALSGREAAARSIFTKLIEVDPLTPSVYCLPGFVSILEGEPKGALFPYRRFYDLAPENPAANWFYTWALAWNDQIDEAAAVADRFVERAPLSPYVSAALLIKHALRGEARLARDAVTDDLRTAARNSEMFSRELANFLALVGETDDALDYLENANRLGLSNYPFVAKRDRFLENLHGKPRFRTLVSRMEAQWTSFEV